MSTKVDRFGARGTFATGSGEAVIYRLSALEKQGIGNIAKLFDEEGRLTNEGTKDFLKGFMQAFAAWIEKLT